VGCGHTNRLPIQRIRTRDRLPVQNPLLGHSPAANSHDTEIDDCHTFFIGRLGNGEFGVREADGFAEEPGDALLCDL
jgi:hypothetical protein